MKPLYASLAAVAALAAGPALADCDFDNGTESVDLASPSLIDPYGGNVVKSIAIPIDDGECGEVFVEIPAFSPLDGLGGAGLPVVVSVTNGSPATDSASSGLFRFSDSVDAIRFDVTVLLDGSTAPVSGTYMKTATLNLYGDVGRNTLLDTVAVTLTAPVDQSMTISLTGIAGNVLDLGVLVPGQTKTNDSATLHAVSNDPYQITFDSANGWDLIQDAAGDATYRIPYTFGIPGQTLTTDPATVGGLSATDSGGSGRRLTIVARPTGDLRAGSYEDEVTITITGDAGG